MSSYSVAEAKNGLPSLIDRALDGEEVLITRHGRAVAELRSALPGSRSGSDKRANNEWLRLRRQGRPAIAVNSLDVLREIADERAW